MKALKSHLMLLWRRYCQAEIPTRAAALAYHSLLAIVPMVGLVFWYLGSIHVLDRWMQDAKNFVLTQLNVDSESIFLEHFERLTSQVIAGSGGSWGWVGVVILVYTAWNLIDKFGHSLDVILETQGPLRGREKSKIKLAVRRFSVMIGMPIAVTISLAVTNWIQKDSLLNELFKLGTVGPLIALPVAWTAVVVAYFFVYLLVPRNPVPWRQALKVAVIVGPTSEVVRFLFGLYSHYAVSVHKVYGVFAVIPMLILWVHVAWMLMLAGALFIHLAGVKEARGQS